MSFIKGTLLFALGAAIGAGCGWYFTKAKIEKKADDEIADVKNYYQEKYLIQQKAIEQLEEQSKKIDKTIDNYAEKIEKGAKAIKKSASKKSRKTDYNKIGVEEKKQEEEIVKAEKESPEEDEPTKPYLITEDEYLNTKNEYDKISLTYYTYDDTLADEYDEMVDIEETISSDIYNQIASSDEDLYVRNNTVETDFEIMKVEASFHERYGGF